MKRISILYDDKDSSVQENANSNSSSNENSYDFKNIISDLNLKEVSKFTTLPEEEINYVLNIMTNFRTTKNDIKIRHDIIKDFLKLDGFYDIFVKQMNYFGEIKEKLIAAKLNMMRVHADVSSNSNAFLNYNRITSACLFFNLTYKAIYELYREFKDIDIKSPHLLKFTEFLTDLIENSTFKQLSRECEIFNDHLNEGVIFDIEMKLNSILRIISLRLYDFRYVKPVQTGLFYSVMRALSLEEKQKKNKYIYIEKDFTQTSKISSIDDMYLKSNIEYQINLVARRLAAIYETLIDLFTDISGELVFYNYALRMINYMRRTDVPYCFADITDCGSNGDEFEVSFEDLTDLSLTEYLQTQKLEAVRNDYTLGGKDNINIVIGANQSGKTTFLRSFGTALIFARTGLPVPAAKAKTAVFKNLYTHFQRYDAEIKNEGQLDTELEEMEKIVYSADKNSVLLMNESFSSTGIKDALQIAVDVTAAFSHIGAKVVYVTHIQNLFDKLTECGNISDKTRANLYKTMQDKNGEPTYKLEKVQA